MEQRPPQKPFLFGRGAGLTKAERESVKERIALYSGIVLAAVLALLLGWGWYQDNIAGPAAAREANNRPIAQVGSYAVRTGYFKNYEKFQVNRFNNLVSQLQTQQSTLQANPKKNASALTQVQLELQQLQQQESTLPQDSLKNLIDLQTIVQRAGTVGVSISDATVNAELRKQARPAGGMLHLQAFINQSGLSMDDYRALIKGQLLETRVAKKLAATVPRRQNEVRASHILVRSNQHALATSLLHKVQHGANIAQLAKKYSIDTVSAKKGGDLGFFTTGRMVPVFDKAAFSMKIGEVRLVHSQFGWHIIKVTDRKLIRLSTKDYQTAQGSAFNRWLQTQQAIITVRHYASPPRVAGLTTVPSSGLVNQGSSLPTQPQTKILPGVSSQSGTKVKPAPAKHK